MKGPRTNRISAIGVSIGEISSTGCPRQPQCCKGGRNEAHGSQETLLPLLVSLQHPLLTKMNLVPAGKGEMFQYHKQAMKGGFGAERQ